MFCVGLFEGLVVLFDLDLVKGFFGFIFEGFFGFAEFEFEDNAVSVFVFWDEDDVTSAEACFAV